MDLKIFPTLFEKAKAVDGEAFDIRFEKAVSLVEQDQFEEAVPLIEQILSEGCLDIRLILQLFYAHFLKEGIQSFTHSFPLLITLIDEQWERLTPIKMRETVASKSIIWFFSTIGERMKRCSEVLSEGRSTSLWTTSTSLSFSEIEVIEKQTRDLIKFFSNKWKLPSSHQYTQYLLKWIVQVKGALNPPKEAPVEKKDEEEKPPPLPLLLQEIENPLEEILLASKKMKELHEKLELFATLIEKRNFSKGALVSDDIKTTIENFNPSAFFPKLFSSYYALIAKHIDTLSIEWKRKGTPLWDSLDQLYHTDLEAFVKW